MRNLLLLFSLRLRRTWNARLLLVGILLLVSLTYLKPAMAAQSVLWCLYAAGLLSLLIFGQLLQVRRMPFAWTLPRSRRAEAGFLALAGVLIAMLVAVWMVSVPRPIPALSALSLGILGYGMGMNPLSIMAALAAAIFFRGQAVDLVMGHPWHTFAASLVITGLPIPFAGRALGLWGQRDYRSATSQGEALSGWRASLARVFLRRAPYTQTGSGNSTLTLAKALAYEDTLFSGKSYAFRRWWTPLLLMAACLCLWLPGALYDVDEYAFLVMVSSAFSLYLLSKFMVIVPRRGHLYPVARDELLRACWLAHLLRMASVWLTWATALSVFCTGLRWIHPDILGGMPWYYPLVMSAFLVILPMSAAQWFAVHYGGHYYRQYSAADVKLGRSLLFLVSELLNLALCLLLTLKGLFWPSLETALVLLLVLIVSQCLLFLGMRHDMLRGDLV